MSTHLLIPIKDIRDKIKLYKKDIETSERGGDKLRAAAFSHMMYELQDLLKTSKRISLDEKDIIRG